jgi:hypothetical protein
VEQLTGGQDFVVGSCGVMGHTWLENLMESNGAGSAGLSLSSGKQSNVGSQALQWLRLLVSGFSVGREAK